MEVRCNVCGSVKHIHESHKNFKAIAHNPSYPFICDNCALRIQLEMQDKTRLRRLSPYPSHDGNSSEKKDF